jgi:hypothetical protein
MALMMLMEWDGLGVEEYEAARNHVNWEGDVPPGAIFHVMAATENSVRVVDVWESTEASQRFVETRLMPGAQELGLPAAPRVEILPAHAIFAPEFGQG